MSYSANEIMALASKAARGGGAPAGQANAFGRAAVVHLAEGRAESDLTHALAALPLGPILSLAIDPLSEQTPLALSYQGQPAVVPARLGASGALMDALSALAHKTYVPATDASRLAGAGAGLTDND